MPVVLSINIISVLYKFYYLKGWVYNFRGGMQVEFLEFRIDVLLLFIDIQLY